MGLAVLEGNGGNIFPCANLVIFTVHQHSCAKVRLAWRGAMSRSHQSILPGRMHIWGHSSLATTLAPNTLNFEVTKLS